MRNLLGLLLPISAMSAVTATSTAAAASDLRNSFAVKPTGRISNADELVCAYGICSELSRADAAGTIWSTVVQAEHHFARDRTGQPDLGLASRLQGIPLKTLGEHADALDVYLECGKRTCIPDHKLIHSVGAWGDLQSQDRAVALLPLLNDGGVAVETGNDAEKRGNGGLIVHGAIRNSRLFDGYLSEGERFALIALLVVAAGHAFGAALAFVLGREVGLVARVAGVFTAVISLALAVYLVAASSQ